MTLCTLTGVLLDRQGNTVNGEDIAFHFNEGVRGIGSEIFSPLAASAVTGAAGEISVALETGEYTGRFRGSGSQFEEFQLSVPDLAAADIGDYVDPPGTPVAPVGHTHTPDEVGLGNVDNTSDAGKPVSTAQQAALDAKANQTEFDRLGWNGVWVEEAVGASKVHAGNSYDGAFFVGWDSFKAQTPAGTRTIAAQERVRLLSGRCLYITLADAAPMPITEGGFNATLGAQQARGEVAILVHNTDDGVAGPLAAVIAAQLAQPSEAVPATPEAAAQTALWQAEQSVYFGGSAYERNHGNIHRFSPPWRETKVSFPLSGGTVDLTNFPMGHTAQIYTRYGCKVWAGRGRVFAGQTGNMADFTAYDHFRVSRVQADNDQMILIEPIIGTPTYTTEAEPVRDFAIALAGQSHAYYLASRGGMGGFQDELLALGTTDSFDVVNGATSGSAILHSTNSANYWWDDRDNTPGPALTAFLADVDTATAAGQPLPEFVVWAQGDAEAWALAGGTVTPDEMKTGIKNVWAYIINNKLPNAQFCVVMPGSNDSATNQMGMAAVRAAYHLAISEVAEAHQGPEMFDLPRQINELHLLNPGYYELGRRLARSYVNLFRSGTQDLGPSVASVTLVDSGTVEITFTGAVTFPSTVVDPDYPVYGPHPFGFMAVPNNFTGPQNETDFVSGKWDGTTLTLKGRGSLVGSRLMFPERWMQSVWHQQWPHDGNASGLTAGLPLRGYRSDPLEL